MAMAATIKDRNATLMQKNGLNQFLFAVIGNKTCMGVTVVICHHWNKFKTAYLTLYTFIKKGYNYGAYKNPHNSTGSDKTDIKNQTVEHSQLNPGCGDKIVHGSNS